MRLQLQWSIVVYTAMQCMLTDTQSCQKVLRLQISFLPVDFMLNSPRDAAIFDFARKLSESPPQANADDVAALQKVGLRDEEILDLILSSSLFGWANRLMHVLGDPIQPDDDV